MLCEKSNCTLTTRYSSGRATQKLNQEQLEDVSDNVNVHVEGLTVAKILLGGDISSVEGTDGGNCS